MSGRYRILHTGETNALTVQRRLKDKGVDAAVPTRTVTRVVRGKKVHELRPVLEGYAFARRAVRVKGVRDVLKTTEGALATVSDEEVAKISTPPPPEINNGLRAGDVVDIVSGPFASFHGTVRSIRKGAAEIRVTIFGGPTHVRLPIGWLKKRETAT